MRSGEDLRVGDRLGRYQLVRELGRGSMGMVFLAEDTMLRHPVCVKVLHASLADHPEATERFNREIVLARRISHKGVCRLHDMHAEGELRYITMEYVDGEPLRDLLQPDRALPSIERVVAIGASICDALAAAHDVGVVHRDLKPRNIMVRPNGEATILDFGIATALDGASALTLPGIALGTKHYIAPEVWAGRPATPAADQFAVGVILYNCLTRRMPFNATRDMMLFDEMSKGPPSPASAHRPEVPPALDVVVLRALAFKPEARYRDVRALRDALLRALPQDSPLSPTIEVRRPGVGSVAPDPVSGVQLPPTLPSIRAPGPASGTDSTSGPPVTALEATLVTLPPSAPVSTASTGSSRPRAAPGFVPSQPDELPASDASWVVSGRPVNLPAIPKRVEGASQVVVRGIADMMEPDERPRPARRTGLIATAIVLAAAAIAAAIIVLGARGKAPGAAEDAGSASHAQMPTPTPTPAPAPVPTDPPELATVDGGAAEAAPVGDDDQAPDDRPETASADPARRRIRPPAIDGARRRHGDAVQALAALMEQRRVLAGDDAELDRLRQRAAQQAQQHRYDDAARSLEDAAARAGELVIDRGFIEQKLARFNRAFDKVEDQQRRGAADARVAKVMSALTEKRYQDANDDLTSAFELLR